MRAYLMLWCCLGVVACGKDSATDSMKNDQIPGEVVDEAGGATESGPGFSEADLEEGEEEEEEDTGSSGTPGDPAAGEAFQYVWEDACDFRWNLVGEVVACTDCDLAFDLERSLSADSTCSGGANDSGTLTVKDQTVMFEDRVWGYVFAMSEGYLTWNTAGYVEGNEAYYYIGYLSH